MTKGNIYIRNFCCMPKYNGCLEKKYLCNYLSALDKPFWSWTLFFLKKKNWQQAIVIPTWLSSRHFLKFRQSGHFTSTIFLPKNIIPVNSQGSHQTNPSWRSDKIKNMYIFGLCLEMYQMTSVLTGGTDYQISSGWEVIARGTNHVIKPLTSGEVRCAKDWGIH